MTADLAVQAAEDAIKGVVGLGWLILPERRALATAAVEAARPIIEAQALNRMADDLGKNVACPDCLRARAAVRTEPHARG